MSSAIANGRPRKQLSDQLDRLDGIIDCLADGLTGAVRDAVRDGARAALKDLLVDALADPGTLAALRGALAPAAVAQPAAATTTRTTAFHARVRAAAIRAATASLRKATAVQVAVVERVSRRWTAARRAVGSVASALAITKQLKAAAAVGLGLGLAAVAVALVSHPAAVVLSGAGTAAAGYSAHLGLWARRAARRLAG